LGDPSEYNKVLNTKNKNLVSKPKSHRVVGLGVLIPQMAAL